MWKFDPFSYFGSCKLNRHKVCETSQISFHVYDLILTQLYCNRANVAINYSNVTEN